MFRNGGGVAAITCGLLVVKPAGFVCRVPPARRGPRIVAVQPPA